MMKTFTKVLSISQLAKIKIAHIINVCVIFLLLATFNAKGQTTYTSTANTNWSSMTWSPAGTPTSVDNVVIAHNVTADVDVSVNNLIINVSRTLLVNSTVFTVNGSSTLNGILRDNSSSGTAVFESSVTLGSGGRLDVSTGISADCEFKGGISNSGTINLINSSIARFSSSSQSLTGIGPFTVSDILIMGDITLTNSSTTSLGIFCSNSLEGNSTNSTFTSANGTTINYAGANAPMSIAGVFNVSASGNTVNYNGSVQDIRSTTYYNLRLISGGAKNIGDINILGSLTRTNGTLNFTGMQTFSGSDAATLNTNTALTFSELIINKAGSTLTLLNNNITTGTLTISAGTFAFGSSSRTVTLTDDLSGNGTLNMNGASHILNLGGSNNTIGDLLTNTAGSRINYNRTGDQEIFSSLNYRTVFISGSGIKTLRGGVRIQTTLDMNSGGSYFLSLGNNTLKLSPEATLNGSFSDSRYIITEGEGVLFKEGNTNIDFTTDMDNVGIFPVGSGGFYTPFTISSLTCSVTGIGSVSVRAVPSRQPNIPYFNNALTKHWVVETSNLSSINSTLRFNFNNAEVIGSVSLYSPRVFNGSAVVTPNNPSAPGSNPIVTTGTNFLAGSWAAVDPTVRSALYSYQSGDWHNINTWTTDPSGNTLVSPMIPQQGDQVVILNGRTVVNSALADTIGSLTINNGGVLDIGSTTNHSFGPISGKGRLRLSSINLPTANYNNFVSADGGTIEYYSTGVSVLPLQSSLNTYNNLEITSAGSVQSNIAVNHNITLNGNLGISKTGSATANLIIGSVAGNRTLNIIGNTTIGAGCSWIVGNVNSTHNVIIQGSLSNSGTIDFTNSADYSNSSNGAVNIHFQGANSNTTLTLNAGSSTTFFGFQSTKSTGYQLAVNAASGTTVKFVNSGATIQLNSSGILRLGANITIPRLFGSNSGNYDLGSPGALPVLWIDGAIVTDGGVGGAVVPYGTIKVSAGSLICENGQKAIVIRESGSLEITGGTVESGLLRTSVTAVTHRGSFFMSGGTFNLTGLASSEQTYYSIFSLPYPENVFQMYGGIINITRVQSVANSITPNGGFMVASTEGNYEVTGGTVNFNTTGSVHFDITSSVPLYNVNIGRSTSGSGQVRLNTIDFSYNGSAANRESIPATALRVLNNLVIQSSLSPAFNAQDNDVIVSGDFTISSGATLFSGNNAIRFNNSIPQNFVLNGTTSFASAGGSNLNNGPEAITSGANYTFERLTSNQNVEMSPINTLTAERIMEMDQGGFHRFYTPFIPSSGPVTASMYVKPNGRTCVSMKVGAFNNMGIAWFNLSGSGSVQSTNANIQDATITAEANGWYRITATAAGNSQYRLRLVLGNGSCQESYSGSSSMGIFAWGLKIETGSVATPYSSAASTGINTLVVEKVGTSNLNITGSATSLLLNGSLLVESGQLNHGTKTVNVKSSVINNTLITGSGSGKVRLNGSNVQIIHGDGDGIYYNLTCDNGGGSAGNTQIISTSSFSIQNNIDLAIERVLDIENNTLNILANATITAGAGNFGVNKFIKTRGFLSDGGIAKAFNNTSAFLFPFGSGANYTPATITFTSAPTTYGTLDVRPVAAQQLYVTDPDAFEYYWKVKQTGFTGIPASSINLKFNYGNLPDNATYIPGYYNFQEIAYTTVPDVNAVVEASNEILFNNWTKLEGDFTAGVPAAFGTVIPYYSRATGNWNNPTTWSNTGHGGNVSSTIPNDHVPVFVGADGYNHTVTATTNNTLAGSLLIGAGSTLDLGVTTGNNFGALPYSTAGGAGTIKISSSTANAEFPAGDFGLFFLEQGGTAEYYTTNSNFILPLQTASPTIMEIPSYKQLVISPSASYRIRFPMRDLIVFQDLNINGTSANGEANLNNSNSQEITVNGNLNVNGGRLRIRSAENQILNVKGNFIVTSGASIDATNAADATHTINLFGNLTNNGSLLLNSTSKIVMNMVGSSSALIDGTNAAATTSFYELYINKGSDETLVTELIIAGSITVPNTNWLNLINGTFRVSRSGTLTLNNSSNLPFSIPANTRLSVNHNGAVINIAQHNSNNSDLILGGKLELLMGVVNIGNVTNTSHNDLEYTASGTPTVDVRNNSMLNINGQVRRSIFSLQGGLTYIQSGNSTVLVRGRNSEGASSFNLDRAKFEILNPNSRFEMSDNALLILDRSGNASNIFGDIYLDPASFSLTGGKVVIGTGNTASNMTFGLIANSPFYNLTIDGTTTNKYINNINTPTTILNDFFIEGDSQFRANGLDITIGGNFTNTHSSSGIGINTGGYRPGSTAQTTILNGSGSNQAIEGVINNLTNFSNLIINNTYPTGSVMLNTNSNIRVNGWINLVSGDFNVQNNTSTVLGDVTNNVNVLAGTGNFILAGSSTQLINGNGLASFDNLRLENTTGADLTAPITINKDLNINQGILYINNHLLTIGETATISGTMNSNMMIRLNGVVSDAGIKKLFPASAGSFTFPFGTTLKYTPATHTISSNSATGSITAKPINIKHPATTDALDKELKFYWSVNSTGFSPSANYSHEYNYFLGDALSGNEANYVAGRYFNNVWVPVGGIPSSVNAAQDKITLSNVNYINGDFTAGESSEFGIIQTYFSRNATSGGNWNDINSWSTDVVLQHDGPAAVIAPVGKNIVIAPGHTITVTDNGKSAPTSILNGNLILGNTFGHNFGVVSGTGLVRVTPTASTSMLFPGGDFALFNTSGGGTFEYQANSAATMPSQATYNNLMFSGSGQKNLPNQDLQVNGNLSIIAGNVSTVNRKISLKGNWTNQMGLPGFTAGGSGEVILTGLNQEISGATGFTKLIIQGGGIKLLNATTYVTVLELNSGIIKTNSNEIVISFNGNVIGGSSNSYVNGNLKKGIEAGAINKLFEVGDDARYAPVNLIFNGSIIAGGNITARTDAGDHPSMYLSGLDANKSCNRTWTLTPVSIIGLSSYAAEFNFNASDLDPSANTATLSVSRLLSGIWNLETNVTNYPTYLAVGGMTAFGVFQLGEPLNGIIWTGNVNTNWNLASNWQPNLVPSSTDDIIIGLVTNQPNISIGSNGNCRNINMSSGVIVSIPSSHNLSITGNINSNNSTFSGAGTVLVNGASAVLTGSLIVGTNIEIASGAILSFDNGSSADFQRVINIQGQLNINQRPIVFGGPQSGKISGNLTTFENVSLNKTANNLELLLSADMNVVGSLSMNMGDLNLNGQTINFGTTGSLSGETAQNKVYGLSGSIVAQRTLNNINDLDVAGLGLSLTSSSNLGLTDITRGHQQRVFNAGFGIDRFYEIHPTNNSSLNATMKFNYFEDELATNMGSIVETELDLWRFDGAYWNVQWATLDAANNQIVKTNISEFSTWTAGSRDNNALPITLINFDGTCNGSMITVEWSTASESNNKMFFLEESEDAKSWSMVKTITGAGNSTTQKNYSESISSKYAGGSYYRLTQVDFNGNSETFDPIYINCEQSLSNELSISPNPAVDFVNVSITASEEMETQLTLFSTSGQILFSKQARLTKGSNTIRLDIVDLPSGAYHLNVTSNKKIEISGARSIIKR
ncbi:MAG: T9SS type A sorting domain-containing protein [Bacteroidia bacterium]